MHNLVIKMYGSQCNAHRTDVGHSSTGKLQHQSATVCSNDTSRRL